MNKRSYFGPAIDGIYQHISDRPELDEQAEAIEYAPDPDPVGEETVKNLPALSEGRKTPDVDGQSPRMTGGGRSKSKDSSRQSS